VRGDVGGGMRDDGGRRRGKAGGWTEWRGSNV